MPDGARVRFGSPNSKSQYVSMRRFLCLWLEILSLYKDKHPKLVEVLYSETGIVFTAPDDYHAYC